MTELPAGGLKQIHVNQPSLLEGRRDVFVIRQPGERTIFCGRVEIMGPSQLVKRESSSGARQVFLETEAEVRYQ